jgi:hypothetical protein
MKRKNYVLVIQNNLLKNSFIFFNEQDIFNFFILLALLYFNLKNELVIYKRIYKNHCKNFINFNNSMNESELNLYGSQPEIIYVKVQDDLSSLGVFIGGLLLGVGSLIAILFTSFQKSRCVDISLGCIHCKRNVLEP